MKEGKAFHISQKEVLNAYKAVKANKGAGGIDGIELEEFDKDWKNRLYVLWNRMSSGSYYSKPVRGVEIPKKNGKKRLLGIPTIEDRVAQMVLRNRLEPLVEPIFLDDSYGYRPNKSALDAIEVARSRCFKMKWVIEFDIVGLFDNISHEKLLELVEKHCHEKWVLMYIDRCLKTPILMPDKTMRTRNSGTPQGGVISPVLANLFMHYAFDSWMAWKFPKCPWERYADDGIIHCVTRKQAEFVLDMLKEQMMRFGLGIDTELIVRKKELRDQQSLAKTTEKAIKKAFGEDAKNLVINSTKSMIGHLLGAAGAVESIVSVKAIEEGFIHQTIGTKELGEGCDLNYAIDGPVEKDIQYAISNSLGFGGHNASLLFKKYEGQV